MVLCESLLFEPFPLPIPQHKENFHKDKTDSSHRRALLKEPGLITTYDLLSKLNFHFFNHHNTRNAWKYIKTNRDRREAEGNFQETEITYRLNSTWSIVIILCSNGPGTPGIRRLWQHSLSEQGNSVVCSGLESNRKMKGEPPAKLGGYFSNTEKFGKIKLLRLN